MSHTLRPMGDDDPIPMSQEERSVWIYLGAVAVTFVTYLIIIVPRVLSTPIAEVSWKAPLIAVLVASIVLTILGSIVGAIGGAIGLAVRGIDPSDQMGSDARDAEISRRGFIRGALASSVGLLAVLTLAMLEVDHFWIANAVYLAGTVGAVIETTVKIRAYREGF